MSYSRNFGFRSFENIVRDGRFRAPSDKTLVIGEPVALDASKPGFLAQAASGIAPGPACGVIVYEHIQPRGMDAALNTYSDFNTVPAGQYAQMVHGVGVKIWLKNTAQKTMYDGRVQAAGGLLASSVTVGNLVPGDGLTPDGAGKFKVVGVNPSQNEKQVITASSDAKFTVTFDGQTTSVLDNSSGDLAASAIQTALTGLSSVGSGNATVSGNAGGPWTVTFGGDLAGVDVPTLTVTKTAGASATVAVSQEGAGGQVWLVVEQANSSTGLVEARFAF